MNQIFTSAAKLTQLLCNTANIQLDPPRFEDQYVSFDLKHWHGIDADFFIRAQSVGITFKGEDIRLFYLLQNMIQYDTIKLTVKSGGIRKPLAPNFAGDGQYSMTNQCPFYLAAISSGNLKGCSDLQINRDPATFEDRATFLADLLFTQWIVKMMPVIHTYKMYKRNGLLAPIKKHPQ